MLYQYGQNIWKQALYLHLHLIPTLMYIYAHFSSEAVQLPI